MSVSESLPAFTPRHDTVVAVQALTKTFKDFWLRSRARAVDNVTFHIDRAEVFGLLGPNGSGKSTTIKIMLGLLHQTSGRVAVFGKPPTDVGIKKRIGYLPEESYLYPFLDARETLDYYGKLFQLDYKVRQRRIDELLDMVGLTAVQFRAVREYSKGMQRRIGIAQALINDPEFLILDEPTTGLDPIGTRQIKDLIIELGRRGKSILLSSHVLGDVEDCVHRMVILYGGKIQREGTCDSLLTSSAGTVIECDQLDDETVSMVDQVIRSRSGGDRAIRKVSKPRQKLESLFIDMVEKARAARIETSGAQHGGQTAAFLRGPDQGSGEALIRNLMREDPAPAPAPAGPTQAAVAADLAAQDRAVIDSLIRGEAATPPPPPTPPKPAAGVQPARPSAPAADVDTSVINALLGGSDGDGPAPGGPR